jgi:serine protease AprX
MRSSRRARPGLFLFLFVALIAVTAMAPLANAADGPSWGAKVDPRVLADTNGGAIAHFLVRLAHQADVRTNAGLSVYQALQQAAAVSQPAVVSQLQALKLPYRAYRIVNLIAVVGDRAAVQALASRQDVAAIEPDRAFRVPLEYPEPAVGLAPATIEWNLDWVRAPQLWQLGISGQGMVYANADTGVEWDHPALLRQYRGWDGAGADHNYNWWDAIHEEIGGLPGNPCGYSSAAPCDDHGHGTHTTGIGVGDDSGTHQIGMAPGARWIACRNMENGLGRPSTYIECLDFFLAPWDLSGANPNPDLRPDVVSNSYACPPSELCSAHSLQTAIENLRAAGVFFSASAGNSGPGCETISDPPALEAAAFTVGATNFQSNTIANLSSRGPVTVDGSDRRKPDLVAPGISINSSMRLHTYSVLSGTSMAAPHVAGAVALLWSAFPELRGNVEQSETALEQSALPLTTSLGCGGEGPAAVPNNVYGYGQLDVLAAYDYLLNSPPTATPTLVPTATLTPTLPWWVNLPVLR